ncbi:mediator of RNA polymerase II transcription subunit 15a-like isoform X1 [Senna tora]|uniref:Mediator of RNA polymerase II transcription subunit 15a-like isoform X1 n=1 Tax=Senna tora TaxID=362788 RepID=A0A834XDF3_9FABA|nr:mediator of RNA polymerase II transcription subunit 15a-like isoform X1 [Senna tora]
MGIPLIACSIHYWYALAHLGLTRHRVIMDAADWRAQLQPDFRQRQVNEIMSALMMHYPFGDEDKLVEIEKVSQNFEHKAFAGATSQVVYLQRISLMILSILGPNRWRAQLRPDSRQRIVNKIMDTFQRRLPLSGPDELDEYRTIAERFEDRIYNIATSQSDYLRKISLKMLSMEIRGRNDVVNLLTYNPQGGTSNGTSANRIE